MNDVPSAAVEVARQTPLIAGAAYLNFVSTYGAAIVTTLAIIYGVLQLYLRTHARAQGFHGEALRSINMAASEGVLGDLHVLVAQVLKERLGNAELCTAVDVNAAIKFLKDNNITATAEANEHLKELQQQLEGDSGIDKADDEELQRALDNIVNFPGGVHAGVC